MRRARRLTEPTAIADAKATAREVALAVREAAHAAGQGAARCAAGHALGLIGHLRGVSVISGYLPIRSEIDPQPLMFALHGLGFRLCVPVITARREPLRFREWAPGTKLERGAFGVSVPASGAWLEPEVMIVPCLAFDDHGHRLGYGGGFYDRSIAALRQHAEVRVAGLAYAAQRVAELPREPTDARMDVVITEDGVVEPAAG
jgi:5-formyltetrahydrofolate cyclo-ligase